MEANMSEVQPKDLFMPQSMEEEVSFEDKKIHLIFSYGNKNYTAPIDQVRVIIDLPFYVPFPKRSSFLGIFNLRGSIIPVFDPDQHLPNTATSLREGQLKRLRLIVFELETDELVGVPAFNISKKELEFQTSEEFVNLNGVPYESFDINRLIKESK
jgi:hypothetical protein